MSSRSPESTLDDSLRRLEWQPVVLGEAPRRLDLLPLEPTWPTRELRVRVHRNTAVEYVTSLLPPFLGYAGLAASFEYGDYDDSLSWGPVGRGDADVELVWLDFGRYPTADPDDLAGWLLDRLCELRARTTAPVLVADHPGTGPTASTVNRALELARSEVPGLAVADLSVIARRVGEGFADPRTRDVGGTSMSGRAAVLAAQRMGLRWLPALVAPRVKAVAVDLDMTLYDGVLGEDGPGGVVLTPGHETLQRSLRDLKDEGVLLALVSRNEPADVEALFAARADFPIRLEDFSALAIGWGAKSEGLAAAAEQLRIGTDAVVFVDDNAGELAEVASGGRVGGLVHAVDARGTATALALFPGLHGHPRTDEDYLRAADLAAAADRALSVVRDPDDYQRSLRVRLDLRLDDSADLPRMADLAARTNQFNAALRRSGQAEFARWLADEDAHVVTASLQDRLSDSGTVAVVAGRRDGDRVLVEELCISCRALGRDVEDVLLAAAVGRLMEECGVDSAVVAFRPGPRNDPARTWLTGHGEMRSSETLLDWDRGAARAVVDRSPVTVTWEDDR